MDAVVSWLLHGAHSLFSHWWLWLPVVGILPIPVTIHKRRFSVIGNKRVEEVFCDVPAILGQYVAESMKIIDHVTVTGPDATPIGASVGLGAPSFINKNGVNFTVGGATTNVWLKIIGT